MRQNRGQPRSELLALIAFQLLLSLGFTGHIDVNVWDEEQYMRQTDALLDGRWSDADYAWSLPLATLYGLLKSGLVPVHLHVDLIATASALAACVGLWWALRPLLGGCTAFLAGAWWASSSMALRLDQAEANSYALGLALVTFAAGWIVRGRAGVALGLLIVAILNRGEVALWVAASGALWLLPSLHPKRSARSAGLLYAATGTGLLVLLNVGWSARTRSWLAFRQHFQWGHPKSLAAEEAFPGASSLAEAVRSDPAAFGGHVLRNVAHLPGEAARLLLDVWSWMPTLRATLVGSLALLVLVGLVRSVRSRIQPWTSLAPRTRGFFAASLAVLPVPLLLLPRPPLLMVVALPALFLLFFWARAGCNALGQAWPRLQRAAPLAPWLAVALAAVLGGPFRSPAEPLPHRSAVMLLRDHRPSAGTLMAAQADALARYAELEGVRTVNPTALDFRAEHDTPELSEIVRRFDPDLVLDTPLLRRQPGGAAKLLEVLAGPGWSLLGQRGPVSLYARKR